MLTKAQWDAMSPQQQWDFVQSLMVEVEAIESARFDVPLVVETKPVETALIPLNIIRIDPDDDYTW